MHEKLEVFASTGHEEEEEKIKKLLSVPKWENCAAWARHL